MEKVQGKQAWEVTSEKVETAIRKIIEISQPLKLILFGSYVRGDTDINSDLDIVVRGCSLRTPLRLGIQVPG
jgi:predicted nucleotidyltransferase